MTQEDDVDEAWLLARAQGSREAHPDPERGASYEHLERALAVIHSPLPPDAWQAGVWAKIDRQEGVRAGAIVPVAEPEVLAAPPPSRRGLLPWRAMSVALAAATALVLASASEPVVWAFLAVSLLVEGVLLLVRRPRGRWVVEVKGRPKR